MANLILLHDWKEKPESHVIFVHGLGGDAYDTWTNPDGQSWCDWIADEHPSLAVWTYSYTAPMLNWFGNALPLQDAARAMYEVMANKPGLLDKPIVFVCHSLGGLMVKQMLREANDRAQPGNDAERLIAATRGVAFAGTPHFGSVHASLLDRLRLWVWPSNAAAALIKNDPNLRSLNTWYRNWSPVRETEAIRNAVFVESIGTLVGVIVAADSGDGGLPGVLPITIPDRHHIDLVKPPTRDDLIHQSLSRFVGERLEPKPAVDGHREQPERPALTKPRINWLPYLLRLALLLVIGFLLFVGTREIFFPPDPFNKASVEQMVKAIQRKNPDLSREQIDRIILSLQEARGDPSFAKAVEEAKKGNTEIAIGMWKQIYENRKREASSAVAEQAEAARNVAATMMTRSTGEALYWYRDATKLDPSDMGGWIGLGDAAILAGTIQEAERAHQKFQMLAKVTPDAGDDSLALNRIGTVRVRQGNLVGALAAYEAALAIVEKLAAGDASNREWQRNLSVSHSKIGEVRMSQGDLAGALAAYEAALAIDEKLAAGDASNREWQRELSVSHNKIGDVRVRQGDLLGALAAYEAALAIVEKLAAGDASNREWQRDLSVSHNLIGDVRVSQGELAGALSTYEAAFAIVEKLAAGDASNRYWQRDLSVSHERIGDVRVRQGDLAGALAAYDAAFAIAEKLAASDASNREWQRDLSMSHVRFGDVRISQGDLAGALSAYEAAIAIAEKLAAGDPSNREWQRDLIVIHVKLSEASGAPVKHLEKALVIANCLMSEGHLAPEDHRMLNALAERLKAAKGQ
jgi:tetratricopeptide (TPR) repeat protein